jgi:general stress protein YciG
LNAAHSVAMTEERFMATTNNRGSGHQGGRGFAGMDEEKQRKIAQKGGEAVSRDREHMSEIGRKGGEASGGNRSGNRGATTTPNR